MSLNLNNSALIVVDVQNGFINKNTEELPIKILELIRNVKFRYKIFTQFINKKDSQFRRLIEWNGMTDLKDIEIVPELKDVPDIIFKKNIYTVINDDFLNYITKNNIKSLYIVGTDTDICVTKIAVDLFELNLNPYVLTEYCASHAGEEIHNYALKILPRYIGKNQVITDAKSYFGNLWGQN